MARLGCIVQQGLRKLFDVKPHFLQLRVHCFTNISFGGGENLADLDEKNTVKSKICKAIECRQQSEALHHIPCLFNLKSVTVSDCNEVLRMCWTTANAKVAKVIWKCMDDRGIKFSAFSVACLLSALSQGGYLDEALELLYMLGRDVQEVQPHVIYCSMFLNGCSHLGSTAHAEKCLRLMKEKGIKEDELVYLELMKLAGKKKELQSIQKAWALMVNVCKPAMPSLDSYCAAVKALCVVGSFKEALTALREMVQLVSREGALLLLSERKLRVKNLCKNEEISSRKEHTENSRRDKKYLGQEMDEGDRHRHRHMSGIDEDNQDVNLKAMQGSTLEPSDSSSCETSSVENGGSGDLQEDDLLYPVGEESLEAAKSPYGDIFGWTRLAMFNLQQTESGSSSESLQSVASSISGFYSDRFAQVKILLRHAFNAVINAAVNAGEFHSAELLFSQMRSVELKPDIYTYNAMLRAVIRGRGVEHGFRIIESMERKGLQPDFMTYNAILEGFCVNWELEKAEALLERMLKSEGSPRPSEVSFNIMLKACADADDLIRALRIFSMMVETKVKPDRCTILYLLSAFGRVNAPYERGTDESKKELAQRLTAIELYMEKANMQHNSQTFHAVLVALGAEGMTDAVVQRLHLAEGCAGDDGVPILDTITFNTAINACIQAKQWNAAKDIFKRMTSLGFKTSTYTYNILINGCVERKKIGDAFQFLDAMQEEGLKPTLPTYNSLMKVCCHAGELDAAVALLKEMDDSGIEPGIVTFNTLLASAVYQERLDMVEFLVEHMHRGKVQPDITTCEHVVTAYLNCHLIDDAAEALRVLSIRMLPEGRGQGQVEEIFKKIILEDSLHVESSTIQLLKDALISKGLISEALLAARLSGFGNAAMEGWNVEESSWARRSRDQYRPVHLD